MRSVRLLLVLGFVIGGLALSGPTVVERWDVLAGWPESDRSAPGTSDRDSAIAASFHHQDDDECDNSGPGNCEDRKGDDDRECDNSGPGNCEDRRRDGAAPTAPAATTTDGAVVVQIVGRSFQPSTIEVEPGQAVTFVNTDDDEHIATGNGFDTGVIPPGSRATVTLSAPGSYPFVCAFHPEMTGTIVVGDGGATPAASPVATPAAVAAEASVAIVDFAFEAETITVPVGTTVVWTNDGEAPHTVTGDWVDSGTLMSGDTFRFTFEEPGSYPYACLFHPEMVGEVIVQS